MLEAFQRLLRRLIHGARFDCTNLTRERENRAVARAQVSGSWMELEEFERRLAPAAPIALSIDRVLPVSQFTSAASVLYAVQFDQPVAGVDASDFQVMADSTLQFN